MTQRTERIDYKELLTFMMHELRLINSMIKDNARLLSVATKGNRIDEQSIRDHVSTIVEQSLALSSWLAIIDFYVDPDRFAKEPRIRVSLHEIFYKVRANFKRIAGNKHIRIDMLGDGKFYTKAHPIIDIIPYILINNALKYSPPNGIIEICFSEGIDAHKVKITSMGPYADENELKKICEIGYRGKYAQEASQIGSGQGLGLLTAICTYHDAKVEVSSNTNKCDYNGIPYSEFNVILFFKKV